MRRTDSEVCRDKTKPDSDGQFWNCSLDPGHKGNHEAYTGHDRVSGKLCATWPNAAPAHEAVPPPERAEALAAELFRHDHTDMKRGSWPFVEDGVQESYRARAAFALRWVTEHPDSHTRELMDQSYLDGIKDADRYVHAVIEGRDKGEGKMSPADLETARRRVLALVRERDELRGILGSMVKASGREVLGTYEIQGEIRRLQSIDKIFKKIQADRDAMRRLVSDYRDAREAFNDLRKSFVADEIDAEDLDKGESARKAARRALFAAVKEPRP